jgi:hypothetical protein
VWKRCSNQSRLVSLDPQYFTKNMRISSWLSSVKLALVNRPTFVFVAWYSLLFAGSLKSSPYCIMRQSKSCANHSNLRTANNSSIMFMRSYEIMLGNPVTIRHMWALSGYSCQLLRNEFIHKHDIRSPILKEDLTDSARKGVLDYCKDSGIFVIGMPTLELRKR